MIKEACQLLCRGPHVRYPKSLPPGFNGHEGQLTQCIVASPLGIVGEAPYAVNTGDTALVPLSSLGQCLDKTLRISPNMSLPISLDVSRRV